MLSEFCDSAARIHALRSGRAGALLEGFAQARAQAGYAEITARRHLRAAEHFIYWGDRQDIAVRRLTERSLERFGRHLRRCRCPRYGHTHRLSVLHGARVFLEHLQEVGLIAVAAVERSAPAPALLMAFREWMRQQRDTCESTLDNYAMHIRELLRRFGKEPERFDARSLRDVILEASRASGWAAAKKSTTALRMFVRFLIAEGRCAIGWAAAIPVLAHWRLATLPRYLQAEDVERLIGSCDLRSLVGRRDRAILLLLARLGLRAGDIVQLRLSDVYWKGAWIHVCGKGRRQTRLPLTQEVGQALVAYLKDGRPWTESDTVANSSGRRTADVFTTLFV